MSLPPRIKPSLSATALAIHSTAITTREMLPDLSAGDSPHRVQLGGVLLAPLILGYKLGLVSGSLLRAARRMGFTGVSLSAYQDHGRGFATGLCPACCVLK
jgi:hypothetical protein